MWITVSSSGVLVVDSTETATGVRIYFERTTQRFWACCGICDYMGLALDRSTGVSHPQQWRCNGCGSFYSLAAHAHSSHKIREILELAHKPVEVARYSEMSDELDRWLETWTGLPGVYFAVEYL